MMIGQGFDAHRFATAGTGRPLWLAGLLWPVPEDTDPLQASHYEGIEGDSDGDVAAHALIDALLAAAGLGDIGSLFGVGADAHGAGMHGADMLKETTAYLTANGYKPVSASVVIVGNRPKIGTRRAQAETVLSTAVGCRVSLTATTTDHMGFTGSGEGIAAIANALVVRQ
ncbi:2-C-methyl-D-erythritol 2,4-cyclodiphosphate synthase [Bifidobacterium olomucense]|nr:2-C-methyl-D-erythritol 2,4-cyclodiphosphate synthase [Bifidobacterium sp. DSM 109959]